MNPSDVLALAREKNVTVVDVRFSDLLGTWQHFSVPLKTLTEATFDDGLGFDGSSIRGWKTIDQSDMLVIPDPTTAWIDPFMLEPTLILNGNIADCVTLSVSLESFTATYTRGSVLIQWTTLAEIDNVGFRILRQREGGKLLAITRSLIPAAGSEVSGATYRFVDDAVQPPGAISYYLEDIDLHGQATRHGPIVVRIPGRERK